MTLLNKIKSINCSILEFSDAVVTKIVLFGDNTLGDSSNPLILTSAIDNIISPKRFDYLVTVNCINVTIYTYKKIGSCIVSIISNNISSHS